MKIQKITMSGKEVELHWGVGEGLGTAVHTVASESVGDTDTGPSDGDTFELGGKQYRLGQHEYSTDQPGCGDDDECECTAPIYECNEDPIDNP